MPHRTCAFCSAGFIARDRRMVYCSKSCCAKAAYRRKCLAEPLPLSAEFTCPVCDLHVPAKGRTGPQPTYCSVKCQRKANYARLMERRSRQSRRKPARKIACADCGSTFEAARLDARFCSRKCLQRWGRKNENGECSEADCERGVRAKGLCNKHYKAVLRADGRISTKMEWTDARREAYHKRRALKKGASTGEPVLLAEIAERDAWMCGLCAEAVDPELTWPDPLSKSLDHVMPLTRGGAHDPSNVQLAHLRCNTAKGNRVA